MELVDLNLGLPGENALITTPYGTAVSDSEF
jgi:hypothetical protein